MHNGHGSAAETVQNDVDLLDRHTSLYQSEELTLIHFEIGLHLESSSSGSMDRVYRIIRLLTLEVVKCMRNHHPAIHFLQVFSHFYSYYASEFQSIP
ncbi:Uncharacterized protein BM_BM18033 [Brugia malayi]|uniref:Uncharacterized protein n=1 Tax=Brugia malayi TaxID=6279 RepID=A0A4E9EZE6_BRUMA|nr:Uncharacterized protein BM_BM18033 [Brugia malayi]VIO88822.1 Uncharacterized protein BM_BM18033 [Brugia malayi]